MIKWLWLSALVVALDQISKQVANTQLAQYHDKFVAIFPGFNFALAYNNGAAFNFLSDASGWQRWFFTALSIIISVALALWIKNLNHSKRLLAAGLAFILGGAIGNVIDRIIYGHVIDFIQVYYHAHSCPPGFALYKDLCIWPSFNLADSAITLGACLLIIDMIMEHKNNGQ